MTRPAPVHPAPIRVLFLTGFPAIGGPLPKLAPLMADGLRRSGCELAVEGWSAHTAGPESLASKLVGRTGDLLRVRRRVRAWRPDVVFVATSHNWPGMLRDVPLALALGREATPLVLHLHGSECGKFGRRGQETFTAVSRWLVRHAAAVLLLSTEERTVWQRFCPGARFEVVQNPYVASQGGDAGAAKGAERSGEPGAPTLLFIGRLVEDKGIFELLEAVRIVRRTLPVRLVVAGMGPAEGEVRRRLGLLGLTDCVELRGYVTGAALDSAYKQADAFVLPSYREGFPLVVMEAMDYGLPVVTTPIRGCADHLAPDVNALFAPPRDAKALAAALLRLLQDQDLRERMGAANVVKVREFAPERVIPQYAEILRGVVAGARAAHG